MIITTRSPGQSLERGMGDVLMVHKNRTWQQFRHLQQGFENERGIRLSYYQGTIEILMPGKSHELFKRIIGILIETFLIDHRIAFVPTGSMTQELEEIAAVEADESYEIGDYKLSLEVNFTSGDVSKLEKYQALGVDEVWFWEDGALDVYHLGSTGYEKVHRSQIQPLSTIDLTLLVTCILLGETSLLEAVQRLRESY